MNATLKRAGWIAGGGLGAALLGWLGYAALTWKRYGTPTRARHPDTLLDRYMPLYEVAEQHDVLVHAPAALTYDVLRAMDPLGSPLVRAIFRGRELLLGGEHAEHEPRSIVDQTVAIGWRILLEEPGREVVVAAVTKPWEANVTFRGLPAHEFLDFHEPGFVKIVWTLAVEPITAESSVAWTETRVTTTDREARRRFRRYWATFSPGILAIRRAGLGRVRREAERHFEEARAAASVDLHVSSDEPVAPA